MTIRNLTIHDIEKVISLMYENVGHGPYLDDYVKEKLSPEKPLGFIGEENGEAKLFFIAQKGMKVSRNDFDGYDKLIEISKNKKIYTAEFFVIDKSVSNRGLGHTYAQEAVKYIKDLGAEYAYFEMIIPKSQEELFLNGKKHWFVRDLNKNGLFEKYVSDYFKGTTENENDYCNNCQGKCHCGGLIYFCKI